MEATALGGLTVGTGSSGLGCASAKKDPAVAEFSIHDAMGFANKAWDAKRDTGQPNSALGADKMTLACAKQRYSGPRDFLAPRHQSLWLQDMRLLISVLHRAELKEPLLSRLDLSRLEQRIDVEFLGVSTCPQQTQIS
jgi:hypothetical protein